MCPPALSIAVFSAAALSSNPLSWSKCRSEAVASDFGIYTLLVPSVDIIVIAPPSILPPSTSAKVIVAVALTGPTVEGRGA